MKIDELRRAYVEALVKSGSIRSDAVRAAFEKVPRHLLLRQFWVADDRHQFAAHRYDPSKPGESDLKIIYSDRPLVTKLEGKRPVSSTSQPALVADMLEHLELKPGMKVLEIGAGTGYNAALMSEIVGKKGAVFSIDIQADVADQTRELLDRCGYSSVRMACRDGAQGWESEAPFDRIVATVGCPDISWAWSEQLDSKGFMLIPLAHSYVGHPLVKLASGADVLKGSISGWSGFMEIHGELASPVPPWRDRMEKLLAAPSTLHPWPVGSTDKKEMRDLALFLAMLGLPTVMEDAPITVNPSADSVVRVAPEGLRLHGKDNEWLKKTSAGVERWVSSGRPKRADYKIRLMPPAMASVKLRIGALIFRRKNSLQITEW